MRLGSNNTSINQGNDSSAVSSACYVNDSFSVKLGRIVAYSVVILLSLVGNILIIAIICKYGRARKTVNYAVVNMTAASLMITTTYMPRLIPMFLIGTEWLVHGNTGYVLCKIVPFLHGVAILASVLTLLASSLDTFFAVAFPLRKNLFTPKVAKFAIFLTWALAAIARLPYLIALRTRISKGKHVCGSRLNNAFNNENAREIYYMFLLITFYALPWLAIFIINSTIAIILKTGKTPRQEGVTAVRLNKARGKATRNVIKMMLVITSVFLGCWIIYFLAQIAFKKVPCSFRFWRLFLAHCNCAINPVLFAIFNTTVRRGIEDIVRKFRGSAKQFYVCNGFRERVFPRIALKRRKFYISPRRPTAFSIDESFNMSNLSQKNRKLGASRSRKVGAVELRIINEGGQNNRTLKTSILSFNTLEC